MIFKQEYTASENENILIDKQKAAINKQPQFSQTVIHVQQLVKLAKNSLLMHCNCFREYYITNIILK